MKLFKSTPFLLAVFILTLCSCQKDLDDFVPDNNGVGQILSPSPVQASVSGLITDENNTPVNGATVRSGANTTSTDSRGLFRFSNITLDKYASVVSVDVAGYFKGIRTFSATTSSSNYVKIKLTRKTLAGTVDAGAGGAVSLPNNSIVTLNSNSIITKSTGQVYTGIVNVYAAYIDPTLNDISQTIPGSFQATDANDVRVLLKSYGMLAVQLESQSGELLQIASGKTAKLRFEMPYSLSSDAASTIPLWSLNETDGLWKQEGTATKSGTYYEGEVSHFSFWNCDQPFNAVYLELTVTTAAGPLPGTAVKITRTSNGASTYGYTDSSGHVGGMVYSNEQMLLEVLSSCFEPVYSQNIGPFTQNTDLGTITVTNAAAFILNISGNAVDCNSQPVSNGTAIIYGSDFVFYVPIINGSFLANLIRCEDSNESLQIIAVDNSTQTQSTTWTGTSSTGSINTGTLIACGITTQEYINYTVDNASFSFSSNNGDSLYHYANQGTPNTLFRGFSSGPVGDFVTINMNYTGVALGSLQPLVSFNTFDIENGDTTQLVNPVFINITEFGDVGQFISGEFSGSVMATYAPNQVYNVTCNFRIRRSY